MRGTVEAAPAQEADLLAAATTTLSPGQRRRLYEDLAAPQTPALEARP
ncbi:hypothetical protein ACWDZX_04140 [Streptomyces collinus]